MRRTFLISSGLFKFDVLRKGKDILFLQFCHVGLNVWKREQQLIFWVHDLALQKFSLKISDQYNEDQYNEFANNFGAKYAFEGYDQFGLRKMQRSSYADPLMNGIKAHCTSWYNSKNLINNLTMIFTSLLTLKINQKITTHLSMSSNMYWLCYVWILTVDLFTTEFLKRNFIRTEVTAEIARVRRDESWILLRFT